jgi:hypothetical protein
MRSERRREQVDKAIEVEVYKGGDGSILSFFNNGGIWVAWVWTREETEKRKKRM